MKQRPGSPPDGGQLPWLSAQSELTKPSGCVHSLLKGPCGSIVLNFPKNAFPAQVDSFLGQLVEGVSQPLAIPKALDNDGAFGGAPLAVQAIASWARRQTIQKVQLPEELGVSELERSEFAASLAGMGAMYFANEVEAGDRRWMRLDALRAVAPHVMAMNRGDFSTANHRREAGLVCFAGARAEFLSPLYARPELGFVREATDFRVLLRRVLKSLDSALPAQLNEGQHELLSAMLHQLFQNTDEHGAFDAEGRKYARAMRGVFVRLTTLENIHTLMPDVGKDVPLKAFLSKSTVPRPQEPTRGILDIQEVQQANQTLRFLELSVFDTGPGMALKWLSKASGAKRYEDFSKEDELGALKACFAKHATTKMALNSGIGLPMALMAMKRLNAFMALRTGRMSLYQDFSAAGTEAFDPKPRGGAKEFSAPEIAGTSYTIVFKVN